VSGDAIQEVPVTQHQLIERPTAKQVVAPRPASADRLTAKQPVAPPQPDPAVTVLVEDNLALVGHLVREMLAKVPPHVSRDDLTSAAMMALVVSAQGFDASRGVPFARFAAIRIRGALMDELRSMDWAARSVRGRAREVESVRSTLAASLGRTPSRDEVAVAMGLSASELDTLNADLARASVLRLQGFAPETGAELLPDPAAGPEALILMRERLGYLHDAIAELPERMQYVVTEYFFGQRQMADIAADLQVTESRVSQLRAEALALLRDGMNSQLEPTAATAPTTKRSKAGRVAYFSAIAERGTVASRLAKTSLRAEILPASAISHSQIA
jgi:RNA polymerase sigma factor for flagellar operon FliA